MQTTLITGTSSGIGFETALLFARQGRKVYATMRNLSKASSLKEIAARENLSLQVLELDVTRQESVEKAMGDIHSENDQVDVLINNAGIGCAAPLEILKDAVHHLVFETNYFGAIRMIQAVLPGMREAGRGKIINISSFAGRVALPNQSAYCASKFALEAACEALAAEVMPFGIDISIIEPGVVDTEIFSNAEKTSVYDKGSPYLDIMRKNGKLFAHGRSRPEPVKNVADLILSLAGDRGETAFRLRHLIGKDAGKITKGRRTLSDEQWITLFGNTDMAAYIRAMDSGFGIDLYPSQATNETPPI